MREAATFDRSLLSERPLLSFERFLICAVWNIRSHLDCFLVQGDRVGSKLLKVEYAAEKHVAPLNQPPLRISCRVVDRLAIELDGCFEPIVLSLDLVVLVGLGIELDSRRRLSQNLSLAVKRSGVVGIKGQHAIEHR